MGKKGLWGLWFGPTTPSGLCRTQQAGRGSVFQVWEAREQAPSLNPSQLLKDAEGIVGVFRTPGEGTEKSCLSESDARRIQVKD